MVGVVNVFVFVCLRRRCVCIGVSLVVLVPGVFSSPRKLLKLSAVFRIMGIVF